MDLVVRADASVLGLQGEGERGDVKRQDVGGVADLTAVQQAVHQSLTRTSPAVVGARRKQPQGSQGQSTQKKIHLDRR